MASLDSYNAFSDEPDYGDILISNISFDYGQSDQDIVNSFAYHLRRLIQQDEALLLLYIRYLCLKDKTRRTARIYLRADCRRLHRKIVQLFDGYIINGSRTQWEVSSTTHDHGQVDWNNFHQSRWERDHPRLCSPLAFVYGPPAAPSARYPTPIATATSIPPAQDPTPIATASAAPSARDPTPITTASVAPSARDPTPIATAQSTQPARDPTPIATASVSTVARDPTPIAPKSSSPDPVTALTSHTSTSDYTDADDETVELSQRTQLLMNIHEQLDEFQRSNVVYEQAKKLMAVFPELTAYFETRDADPAEAMRNFVVNTISFKASSSNKRSRLD